MAYQREFETRLRIGVVGVGSHSYRNILPTLHHLPVKLVSLCDTNLELAKRTAPEYGVDRVYSEATEMYTKEELDAVFLCTGPRSHAQLTQEAFKAGLHVWLEKPPAMRISEIEDMLRLQGNRVCVVGFKKAFLPATDKALEVFSADQYGKVHSILAVYPMSLPADGEAVLSKGEVTNWLANGVHPLAFMLAVGGRVNGVTAHRGQAAGGAVLLDFETGAFGNLHLAEGASSSQPVERYSVFGDGIYLTIDNTDRVSLYRSIPFEYGRTTSFAPPGLDHGTITWEPQRMLGTLENQAAFTHGTYAEMRHFCDSVLHGVPATRGTLQFARHVMQVYEAALGSKGQRVPISA